MAQFTTEVDQLAKELSWLRQEFDGIKGVVNGWTGGAGTDPYFQYLRARDGFFDKPILESVFLRRDTSQTIPSGVNTAINWDRIIYNTGLVNVSTIVNSSRIYVSPLAAGEDQTMLITGVVDWGAEAASTGNLRITVIRNYRADGSSIGGSVLGDDRITVTLSGIAHAWAIPFRHNSSEAYLSLELYQDTSSDISIDFARIGILRIA